MSDHLPITAHTFRAVIPARLQSYLNVWSPGIEEYYRPVVDALRVAAESIDPVVRRPNLWFICFATSPFRLEFPTGILTFERSDESINTTIENIAFIDCKEVLPLEHPFRVAAILSELVHLLLNVKDNDLTMQIVCWLYKGVVVRDGWYELA